MKSRHLFVLAAAMVSATVSRTALGDDASVAAAQQAKTITKVQAELGVPPSGKMDSATQAALKKFQRAKGLQPSGKLDKPTLAKLGMTGPKPAVGATAPAAAEKGRPSTPIGPEQSSAERAAEPKITHDKPTGEH